MRAILFLTGLLLANCALTPAQTPSDGNSSDSQQIQQATQQMGREARRSQQEFNKFKNAEIQKNSSRQGISLSNRQSLPFKMSMSKEQRQRLAPDPRLVSNYAAFLKQPRTGLIKLFPDLGCEANANVLRVDGDCLNWVPNSAFYSFREKEHTSDFLSDISYKNGFLVTDGILSQGILVAIGDVPLESVSLASEGMKFLLEYKPEPNSKDAFNQFIQISNGIRDGKFEYRKAILAAENTTYVLRVIAYKGKFYSTYKGWGYDVLYGDNRVDLTLAFRVLRKEENGNITLLWKELARKDAPRIIFLKKEKSGDSKTANYQG